MMKPSTLIAFTLMGVLSFTGCKSKKQYKQQKARQETIQADMIPDIKMNDTVSYTHLTLPTKRIV